MPKIKVPRKSTHVDMTAMCDVAFLLLTFFILTAKFTPPQIVNIAQPTSRAEKEVKDDLVTFMLDKDGKIYMSISKPEKRKAIVDKMIALKPEKYANVKLSPAEEKEVTGLEIIGVPMSKLKATIGLDADKMIELKSAGQLSGIPSDSTNNELSDWIMAIRHVYIEEEELEKAPIAIRGDQNTNIEDVRKLINTFRDNDVYSYNLITTLEGARD